MRVMVPDRGCETEPQSHNRVSRDLFISFLWPVTASKLAIINLWAQSRNLWEKLPTSASEGKLLYDYWERAPHTPPDYLLLKYPREMREGIFRRIVNKLFHTYWFLLARRIDRTLLAKSA